MKKIILFAIIIALFSVTTKAQTGSILVYGNVGASVHKSTYTNTGAISSFSIYPGIGYQFNNHWTTGLQLGYAETKNTETGYPSSSDNNFSIGPFIRYSQPISSLFSFYTQLGTSYSHSDANNGFNMFEASFFPAVFLNIKNGFGLNFNFGGINYNNSSQKGIKGSSSNFTISLGQGVSMGISKNFGGKKSHS